MLDARSEHPCLSDPVKSNPVENPVENEPKVLQPSKCLPSQIALLVNPMKNCQNPVSVYCFSTSKISHIFNPVSFEILIGSLIQGCVGVVEDPSSSTENALSIPPD